MLSVRIFIHASGCLVNLLEPSNRAIVLTRNFGAKEWLSRWGPTWSVAALQSIIHRTKALGMRRRTDDNRC